MSKRPMMYRLGLACGLVVTVCLTWQIVAAQQEDSPPPESLLPADAILYVGFDGTAAHQEAFEKTAAYDALYKTGLMDVIQKVIDAAGQIAGSAEADGIRDGYETIVENGVSISVALGPDGGPPLPYATIVLHEAAELEPALSALIAQLAEGEIDISERDVNGRTVTGGLIPDTPGIGFGWWTEGNHIVVAVGMAAAEASISIAEGERPNITTNPLWTKYREAETDFDVNSVCWFDFGALREKFSEMPIPGQPFTVSEVLEVLGLDQMGAIVNQSGFKGRTMWSETVLNAPGPRKGLLALLDQKPITLADLPPLPFGNTGFAACSVDWSKFYDDFTGLAIDVAALGPPEAAGMVEGGLAAAPGFLGFDPKPEFFDVLGDVICVYGDERGGGFGMGFGGVLKVDDPQTLRETLDKVLALAEFQTQPEQFAVRRTEKHGREIVTLEFAGGVFSPAFAVDENWLSIGLFPQTVEAFLLRVDGRLTNWEPSRTYQQAFAALPKEFGSIAATDPRKMYRSLVGLAPMLFPALQLGMREALKQQGMDDFELPISLADLPPAELVGRPLFPNVAVCTSDESGIRWTSRSSLPGFPLAGSGGGGAVATSAVLVALLLPAVQQAREAARRAQSKNNLKQLALALHNYHDVNTAFPSGTHENADLKPEKRLSWIADVLPYLDQQNLHDDIDFEAAWDAEANRFALSNPLPVLLNPGNPNDGGNDGVTHYVGIAGLGKEGPTLEVGDKKAGVFGYDRVARIRDILDGTSNTIMTSEASENFGPWGQGGKATVRAFTKKPYINGPDGIGGPWSSAGCNMGFADGSVHFISEEIDPEVLEALTTISGGEVVGGGF